MRLLIAKLVGPAGIEQLGFDVNARAGFQPPMLAGLKGVAAFRVANDTNRVLHRLAVLHCQQVASGVGRMDAGLADWAMLLATPYLQAPMPLWATCHLLCAG